MVLPWLQSRFNLNFSFKLINNEQQALTLISAYPDLFSVPRVYEFKRMIVKKTSASNPVIFKVLTDARTCGLNFSYCFLIMNVN